MASSTATPESGAPPQQQQQQQDETKKAVSSLREVEETVSRIAGNKGVKGVQILSSKGEIVVSTFPEAKQLGYARSILKIQQQAMLLFADDNESAAGESGDSGSSSSHDQLSFVRIRSKQNEFLVAPHGEYILIVLHNPAVSKVDGGM